MPLVKSQLKQAILSAFNDSINGNISYSNPPSPDVPGLPQQMADKLADAYDQYASQALAGVLSISVPASKSLLAQALTAPNFTGWSPGFTAYWGTAMFAGSGFIPANPISPSSLPSAAAQLASAMQSYVQATRDSVDSAAGDLADALDSATTSLMVFATTTSTPPVTSTIPLA